METPQIFDSFEAAREQAAETLGFVASERVRTPSGELFEIPNPSLLDDDQQARYDKLQLDVESWDHHPDVLNEDGSVRVKGALMEPQRKGGKLVENFNVQLAKAILGERYEAFRKAGGRGNDVAFIWWKMNKVLADRRAADSKSRAGAGAVASVPGADRGGAEPVSRPLDPGVAAS
ncbi:MAG: hypothetical protein RBS21_00355 [Corynebacterium sp.]|jgi:hypothetical protein|nr:hypothetical protein [Corynebacterium sp.]